MEIVKYTLKVLPEVSVFSTLIPFVFALLNYKKLSHELKLVFYLIVASIFTEIISGLIPRFVDSSNIGFINVYFIIETIFISLFYIKITANKYWKYIIVFVCLLCSVWSLVYMFGADKNSLNSVAVTIESVAVIIYTLLTYYYFLKNIEHANIFGVPVFWMNTAFLLFFGGNLFLHIFSNYLMEHALYAFFNLWAIIHSSLNIIFNLLISVGFWRVRKFQI